MELNEENRIEKQMRPRAKDVATFIFCGEVAEYSYDPEFREKMEFEVKDSLERLLEGLMGAVEIEYGKYANVRSGTLMKYGRDGAKTRLHQMVVEYNTEKQKENGGIWFIFSQRGRELQKRFYQAVEQLYMEHGWGEIIGCAKEYFSQGEVRDVTLEQLIGSTHVNSSVIEAILGFGTDWHSPEESRKAIRYWMVKNSGRYGLNILFDALPIRLQEVVRDSRAYYEMRSQNIEIKPEAVVDGVMKAQNGGVAYELIDALIRSETNSEHKMRILDEVSRRELVWGIEKHVFVERFDGFFRK